MIEKLTDPREIEFGPRSMVVLFTNSLTCAPCRAFHPHFEQVAKHLPNITYAEVDIMDSMEPFSAYDVTSTPTVLLFREGADPQPLASRTAMPLIAEIQEALGA